MRATIHIVRQYREANMESSIEYLLDTVARIETAKNNDFEGIAVLYQLLDIHAQLVRQHVCQWAFGNLLS